MIRADQWILLWEETSLKDDGNLNWRKIDYFINNLVVKWHPFRNIESKFTRVVKAKFSPPYFLDSQTEITTNKLTLPTDVTIHLYWWSMRGRKIIVLTPASRCIHGWSAIIRGFSGISILPIAKGTAFNL